jgi:hypothetical protein
MLVCASSLFTFSDASRFDQATQTAEGERSEQYRPRSRVYFGDEFEESSFSDESIDINYDALPRLSIDNDMASRGTKTFHVNDKDVKVDIYYRDAKEAANNPNVGYGILLYNAIRYKQLHPTEPVDIVCTSYHLSASLAVNLNANGRYFGYMRSLMDRDYDEFGFVRIAFMLVEAARMGCHVTVVGQIVGARTYQWDKAQNKRYYTPDVDFRTYFNSATKLMCYDEFDQGAKITKYLNYKHCAWDASNKGTTDMQHIKALTVSKYVDFSGNEYEYGVWVGSTNLDPINYNGQNGNNGSQSGFIVTNHKEIYYSIYNTVNSYLVDYCAQEAAVRFRNKFCQENKRQLDILLGGGSISDEERIAYLGSEKDPIFKLVMSPMVDPVGAWNPKYNLFCRMMKDFNKTDDYVLFAWNNSNYSTGSSFFVNGFETIFNNVLHRVKDSRNRVYTHLAGLDTTAFDDLVVGVDLGYKSINTNMNLYVHSKDTLCSYSLNGVRHYASYLTSCTFHDGAFWYQTNSSILIDEVDDGSSGFYENSLFSKFGRISTYGCID